MNTQGRRSPLPHLMAVTLPLAALSLLAGTDALTVSMVASTSFGTRSLRIPAPPSGPPALPGVTGGLISKLAQAALKRRLHAQTDVSCDVTANSSDMLLKGKVGPVSVKGKGWQSPLGLTCRAIEANVETCELDMGRVLTSRKLVLTTPARGNAMVALNSVDFANFITHPLMKPPASALMHDNGQASLEFLKSGVSIDPESGRVTFLTKFSGEIYKCTLERSSARNANKKALISVESQTAQSTTTTTEKEEQLTRILSDFFNDMVFELDGTFLTFRDMMVTSKGGTTRGGPSVMLALSIVVRKFPSPGLAF